MTSLSRSRRARWADVRFLIGIVLVAVSIAGVWMIVASTDSAAPILRASRTIVQGEALGSDDFEVVEVGLGALAEDYLAPQDLRTGQVASRTIATGELIPRSASADAEESKSTTIVVESTTGVPEDVEAGTVVELWAAPLLEDGRAHDTPRILVADVIVAEVIESEGMLADSGSTVELVIDRADVADVLDAITSGAALSVVPVGTAA